jgi:hypothetical protein
LPEPTLPAIDGTYDVITAGIGGTGIVTIGGILGMAAISKASVGVIDMAVSAGRAVQPLAYRQRARGHPRHPRRGWQRRAGARRRHRGRRQQKVLAAVTRLDRR